MDSFRQLIRNVDMALLRRYHVHKPDDESFGVRRRMTFAGARRVALRTRGTRIFVPWHWTHIAGGRNVATGTSNRLCNS